MQVALSPGHYQLVVLLFNNKHLGGPGDEATVQVYIIIVSVLPVHGDCRRPSIW